MCVQQTARKEGLDFHAVVSLRGGGGKIAHLCAVTNQNARAIRLASLSGTMHKTQAVLGAQNCIIDKKTVDVEDKLRGDA
jgi:hypothetical protein